MKVYLIIKKVFSCFKICLCKPMFQYGSKGQAAVLKWVSKCENPGSNEDDLCKNWSTIEKCIWYPHLLQTDFLAPSPPPLCIVCEVHTSPRQQLALSSSLPSFLPSPSSSPSSLPPFLPFTASESLLYGHMELQNSGQGTSNKASVGSLGEDPRKNQHQLFIDLEQMVDSVPSVAEPKAPSLQTFLPMSRCSNEGSLLLPLVSPPPLFSSLCCTP